MNPELTACSLSSHHFVSVTPVGPSDCPSPTVRSSVQFTC